MKCLECECCGFLAVIPEKDDHDDLDCPFCKPRGRDGQFKVIPAAEFIVKADLRG